MPKASNEKTGLVLKRRTIAFIFVTLILFGLLIFSKQVSAPSCKTSNLKTTTLKVNNYELQAEEAVEPAAQQLGLSGRDCLKTKTAMLFSYTSERNNCFWMKDMKIPLDMIWLDGDKVVLKVVSNISPDTYPQTFCSETTSKYVIEINAGEAAELGIKNGSQFDF